VQTAPFSERLVYRDSPWPDVAEAKGWYEEMQFRLIYEGRLPAKGAHDSRSAAHQIRKAIHKQLLELWQRHDFLKTFIEGRTPKVFPDGELVSVMSKMADNFATFGFRWLPLIRRNSSGVACSLDILFLRREEPGAVIHAGDLDNRVKVLFDALQVPQELNQVQGFAPDADEDPFLCLLQNDRYITDFKVTSDRLLTSSATGTKTMYISSFTLRPLW
jgi:hypothetical protein